MVDINKILNLTRQLYPTGRGFRIPRGGFWDRVHKALAQSEKRAYDDALAIQNSMLPDNAGFTEDDATDWERRLGLITDTAVLLSDRKLAIKRKMNHPGDIPARQHFLYLEGQLQAAGFTDVYVYENRFPLYYSNDCQTQSPHEIFGTVSSGAVHHSALPHGTFNHAGEDQNGAIWEDTVANSIDRNKDAFFDVGANLRSTFFVGGSPLGTYATIPAARETEFRQIILRVKPAQSIAFLFIDYGY